MPTMSRKGTRKQKPIPQYAEHVEGIDRVIGIDLSLQGTGICIIEKGSEERHFMVKPGKAVGMQRLEDILGIILGHIGKTGTLSVIEGLSFSSNQSGHSAVVGLWTLLVYSLWITRRPYLIVAPSRLKKWVTARGNAQKEIMVKEVKTRFKIDTNNHNEADAVGLAFLGLAYLGQYEARLAAQRDIVAELRRSPIEPAPVVK